MSKRKLDKSEGGAAKKESPAKKQKTNEKKQGAASSSSSSSTTPSILILPEQNAIIYPEAESVLNKSAPESEIFLGINCCGVCAKKMAAESKVTCKSCGQASYCSTKHQQKDKEAHEKVCAYLKQKQEDEVVAEEQESKNYEDLEQMLMTLVEYGEKQKTKSYASASGNVEEAMNWKGVLERRKLDSKSLLSGPRGRIASTFLSFPLTVIYILEKYYQELTKSEKDLNDFLELQNKSSIVVHVIGTGIETRCDVIWKELALYLIDKYSTNKSKDKLSSIEIVFIAPEISQELNGTKKTHIIASSTDTVTLNLHYHQSSYSQFCKPQEEQAAAKGSKKKEGKGKASSSKAKATTTSTTNQALKSIQTPSLVVGFQLGLSIPDSDDSQGTLEVLSQNEDGVPMIFTSNTREELLMDYSELDELGFSVLVAPTPNPVGSLQILQSETLANDVYRKNAYAMMAI